MTAGDAWVPRIDPGDLLVPADQTELVSALRDVLVTHASSERTRTAIAATDQLAPYDADLWQRLGTDLGLAGLLAPRTGRRAGHGCHRSRAMSRGGRPGDGVRTRAQLEPCSP